MNKQRQEDLRNQKMKIHQFQGSLAEMRLFAQFLNTQINEPRLAEDDLKMVLGRVQARIKDLATLVTETSAPLPVLPPRLTVVEGGRSRSRTRSLEIDDGEGTSFDVHLAEELGGDGLTRLRFFEVVIDTDDDEGGRSEIEGGLGFEGYFATFEQAEKVAAAVCRIVAPKVA